MRVSTKLSVIIAEDPTLNRRVFSVEDLEEADDASSIGGDGRGALAIAASASHTFNLAPLTALKHFVLLVDGDVSVKVNGALTGIRINSRGISGQADFVYGKLLLSGSDVASVQVTNLSASAAAKCLVGYAG